MSKTQTRKFCMYDDIVEVMFVYDEVFGRYFGEYPDFDTSPRTTPCGRRWVNATKHDCPYADKDYGDCGSCKYYKSENAGDLIGVCDNQQLRKEAV